VHFLFVARTLRLVAPVPEPRMGNAVGRRCLVFDGLAHSSSHGAHHGIAPPEELVKCPRRLAIAQQSGIAAVWNSQVKESLASWGTLQRIEDGASCRQCPVILVDITDAEDDSPPRGFSRRRPLRISGFHICCIGKAFGITADRVNRDTRHCTPEKQAKSPHEIGAKPIPARHRHTQTEGKHAEENTRPQKLTCSFLCNLGCS